MQSVRVERLGVDDRVTVPSANNAVAATVETEHLQHPRRWVHEPHVLNPLTSVDGKLSSTIERRRRGREHFANPIRRELEGRNLRKHRHAFAAPAAQIGHESVSRQVQLGLVENHPTPWSSPAPVERAVELTSQTRGRPRVPWRWPRAGDQVTVDDFRDEVLGNALQITVGCAFPGGICHDRSNCSSLGSPLNSPGDGRVRQPAAARTPRISRYAARVAPPRNRTPRAASLKGPPFAICGIGFHRSKLRSRGRGSPRNPTWTMPPALCWLCG